MTRRGRQKYLGRNSLKGVWFVGMVDGAVWDVDGEFDDEVCKRAVGRSG